VEFKNSKLRGKIREKFISERRFADAMNMHKTSLSFRLNNKCQWRIDEIERAIKLLNIKVEEIPHYFFSEASEAK